MLGEDYLRHTNRGPGVVYSDTTGVTTQCRKRWIHSWLGKQRKIILTGYRVRTPGGLWIWGGLYSGGRFGSCDLLTRSMGTGFCNLNVMKWNTTDPLPCDILQEQRTLESSKVVREEEGLVSNRPELVALRECLETHDDHVDLLYLTDNETSLQVIHKWIGCEVNSISPNRQTRTYLRSSYWNYRKESKRGQRLY